VPNTNVVPNIQIYLQENSHNFWRHLRIFPDFFTTYVLYEKAWVKTNSFSSSWAKPTARPGPIHVMNPIRPALTLCVATSGPRRHCGPPTNHHVSARAHLSGISSPKSPAVRTRSPPENRRCLTVLSLLLECPIACARLLVPPCSLTCSSSLLALLCPHACDPSHGR
jgi:hypothetical protein